VQEEDKMIRVKICGITNYQDASTAVGLGADTLGFIFASSPRQVSPKQVRNIISSLPPFVKTVGVFLNEDKNRIHDIMDFCGLDMIQLHGEESPGFCRELMPRVIKAFRVKQAFDLLPIRRYQGQVRALLLDTYEKGTKGGTGKTFDWSLATSARRFGMPVILSGGLKPENIRHAVSTVKPHAVDVNSGIEVRPGKKDPALMKLLFEKIDQMNSEAYDND
jgi:phosphoribosylanthranilate isomerase